MGSAALVGAAFGLQALSQITGAASASQAARYNARVAENSAELSRRLAENERQRGRVDEQGLRLEQARARSLRAAAMAAGGVDIAGGSPLQVLADDRALGELDALRLRADAERDAFRHLVRANEDESEAALSRGRSGTALAQGLFRSGGSLLTGAARVRR